MKRVAILQSNYIPWKGYFDLIDSVDEFILFDDMQYTRRDWRNRNKIKTPQQAQWLTIPVHIKGHFLSPIREIEVESSEWGQDHWKTILQNYRRAPHFKEFGPVFEEIYLNNAKTRFLSEINFQFIQKICDLLEIKTKLSWSSDYGVINGKTERLLDLCQKSKASQYISGPSAKAYLDESLFQQAGIDVCWFDYAGYPEYPQLYPPFDHFVSALDLIFNVGTDARRYFRKAG
jgi:hypothetical protein